MISHALWYILAVCTMKESARLFFLDLTTSWYQLMISTNFNLICICIQQNREYTHILIIIIILVGLICLFNMMSWNGPKNKKKGILLQNTTKNDNLKKYNR